ncbi:hypothetical protein acsn021_02580 [Anaerocolumna cellulosilytica]|uniref:Uncharacterized protein n=1 Tax=Anaerocolumna cellulosilytica TaxID=433286 RepID=A0A6S6QUD6_9FIRM|nr:hypothetical protein [Anaerocolumna cellulosilytica]MBB5196909.1 hypothetical protein [Anaerocolumna cellulosilytica]BCJ92689.1 hypothetical protein acsn021_02580 [Anaerocolumna cellulosilytica]
MEAITYHQLKTNIPNIKRIESLSIQQNLNKHATMRLTGIMDEKSIDQFVVQNEEDKEIEVYTEDENSEYKILFRGIVKEEQIRFVQGICYIEIVGTSYTYLLDIKKRKQSFQDAAMSLQEILAHIMKQYAGWDVQDTIQRKEGVGQLLIQYNETDWEFLKRLASIYHKPILPMINYKTPKLVFGAKEGKEIGKLSQFNYVVSKDLEYYSKAKNNKLPEIKLEDTIIYKVTTRNEFEIGDVGEFQDRIIYIRSKNCEMHGGELQFEYELTTKNAFLQEDKYNQNIVGTSIKGTVLERVNDKVKVQLAIDENKQSKEKAWEFPYMTPYSSEGHSGWYCMPEIGDTVNIYFPSKREEEAVAQNSVRSKSAKGDKITDPAVKYFRTADGKEIKFSKDEICISCKNMYIKMTENDGIRIVSSGNLNFSSGKGITLQAEKEINIHANDQIKLECKSSEIVMNTNIDICGEDVRIN